MHFNGVNLESLTSYRVLGTHCVCDSEEECGENRVIVLSLNPLNVRLEHGLSHSVETWFSLGPKHALDLPLV